MSLSPIRSSLQPKWDADRGVWYWKVTGSVKCRVSSYDSYYDTSHNGVSGINHDWEIPRFRDLLRVTEHSATLRELNSVRLATVEPVRMYLSASRNYLHFFFTKEDGTGAQLAFQPNTGDSSVRGWRFATMPTSLSLSQKRWLEDTFTPTMLFRMRTLVFASGSLLDAHTFFAPNGIAGAPILSNQVQSGLRLKIRQRDTWTWPSHTRECHFCYDRPGSWYRDCFLPNYNGVHGLCAVGSVPFTEEDDHYFLMIDTTSALVQYDAAPGGRRISLCLEHWNGAAPEMGMVSRATCMACNEVTAPDIRYGMYTWTCDLCQALTNEGKTVCPECKNPIRAQHRGPQSRRLQAAQQCGVCFWKHPPADGLHNYSYVPPLVFHPTREEQKSFTPSEYGDLFIGLELETSFQEHVDNPADQLMYFLRRQPQPDLWYAKSDSSVANGHELVSHPFHPEWGLKHIRWDLFDDLVNVYDAYSSHDSCGTHIHLSKAAFSPKQLYAFLEIHRAHAQLLGVLGGRGAYNSWGSLYEIERIHDRPKTERLHAVKTKRDVMGLGRSGVNMGPRASIELRYPAGDITPKGIKKNIQLAWWLYGLADRLPVSALKPDKINDQSMIVKDLLDREDQYPELVSLYRRSS